MLTIVIDLVSLAFKVSFFENTVLYENIDQILLNKLHGPIHYKVGVTCLYNGHVFYTLL